MATTRRGKGAATAATLSPERAAELLRRQAAKARELLAHRPIKSDDKSAWHTVTREVLVRSFGSDSSNISAVLPPSFAGLTSYTEQEAEEWRAQGLQRSLKTLDGLIEMLDLESTPGPTVSHAPTVAHSNRVFIVHGHADSVKHEIARFLDCLGLKPIILHEQPSQGRTIIEKFEDYADVGFALVLLTADDLGGPKATPYDKQQARARQNVVLELGYFLAKLSRKRVCALYEHGVELPSDYNGVLFVPLDQSGAWKLTLARELKAAGMDVDMNDAV